ncbi:MAG: FeoA family protein [Bellilinea sp.]
MGAPVQAKDALITCVTCGLTYSVSQGRDSCVRCPLHEDCSTSCCPKCGTSNINPDKSRLARWLQRILTPRQAQGMWTSPAEPVEAQNSSHKIRTSDFGGGGEGVPVSTPVGAPAAALRQAQGAGGPVAEPVEARGSAEAQNSSHKIRTSDFGGGGEGVPVSTPVGAPAAALRQAQSTGTRRLPAGHSVSEPAEARQAQAPKARAKQRTLAGVQPGREVQITGYGDLNGSQRQHLQGYGLLPGRRVKVLSQHPVTIVQVEQTELAFERGVAARVLVGN